MLILNEVLDLEFRGLIIGVYDFKKVLCLSKNLIVIYIKFVVF